MDNTNLLLYNIFHPFKNLLAFTTTKQTLNIKEVRYSNSPKNRLKLAGALNINTDQLIFPKQTHSNYVAGIDNKNSPRLNNTDALVTNLTGKCLCVQTADCVPLLFYDPKREAIAAVHAGWRGTVGRIAELTIRQMNARYDSQPENILCAIGPSIGPDVYEVGPEVVKYARLAVPNPELCLHKNKKGKHHFNLWEANRQVLLFNGILPQHIEMTGVCSFSEPGKFYSARRDGVDTGRMVTGIMLQP